MNEWKTHIIHSCPSRADTGKRKMWLGKIAYMNNNFKEAKEYFYIADKKSEGRCFTPSNLIYKRFLSGEITDVINTNSNAINKGEELDDDLYDEITQYCEEGDNLFDKNEFDKALIFLSRHGIYYRNQNINGMLQAGYIVRKETRSFSRTSIP